MNHLRPEVDSPHYQIVALRDYVLSHLQRSAGGHPWILHSETFDGSEKKVISMMKKWFRADPPNTSLGKIMKGAATAVGLGAVVAYDLLQKRSGVLRNYQLLGTVAHCCYTSRNQQYFIERDWDGRPFDKTSRELIHARSRDDKRESFGTVTM